MNIVRETSEGDLCPHTIVKSTWTPPTTIVVSRIVSKHFTPTRYSRQPWARVQEEEQTEEERAERGRAALYGKKRVHLGQGLSFGEMAFVKSHRRTASVVTIMDSVLIKVQIADPMSDPLRSTHPCGAIIHGFEVMSPSEVGFKKLFFGEKVLTTRRQAGRMNEDLLLSFVLAVRG